MKGTLNGILIAMLIGTAQPSLACERPDDMQVPNGKTATEAKMLAADKDYKRFMEAMRAYQNCLAAESNQSRPADNNGNNIKQHEDAFVARHNAASDAMIRVTDQFDEAIEVYRSRQ